MRRLATLLAAALLCMALPACTALGGRSSGAGPAQGGAGGNSSGITVFGDVDAAIGRH